MKKKEKREFQLLESVLNDKIVCKRIMDSEPETFKVMLTRYSELIDKIIHKYKLPNLIKGPLKD